MEGIKLPKGLFIVFVVFDDIGSKSWMLYIAFARSMI